MFLFNNLFHPMQKINNILLYWSILDLKDLVSLRSRRLMAHSGLSEFSSSEHSLHENSRISRVINSPPEVPTSVRIKPQRTTVGKWHWCCTTVVIKISSTSHHTFIIAGRGISQGHNIITCVQPGQRLQPPSMRLSCLWNIPLLCVSLPFTLMLSDL